MLKSKWKRLVVVVWLAGLSVLCLWTPHRGPRGTVAGDYNTEARFEGWGTKYGWIWSVPREQGAYFPRIEYGVTGLSLVAWSALMSAVFILLPGEVI